jgi:DNA-binding transcriptional LysR family regulator
VGATIDLNDLAWFLKVVEQRSFSAVARASGVPTSTVSRAVSRLEDTLSVALLRRTTRVVVPTPEGQALFQSAEAPMGALRSAAQDIAEARDAPSGTLRLTAPNDLGPTFVADVVAHFLARYPTVRVETVFTTRRVDLVREGIDVALRAGPVGDPSLVARKLAGMEGVIVASPAYLARFGSPATPEELEAHEGVLFRPTNGVCEWKLRSPKDATTVRMKGRIGTDDFGFVAAVVRDGRGLGVVPSLIVREDLASGRLVRVLPTHHTGGGSLHLVYAASRHVPPKIAAFRDITLERLGTVFRRGTATRAPRVH